MQDRLQSEKPDHISDSPIFMLTVLIKLRSAAASVIAKGRLICFGTGWGISSHLAALGLH